MEAMGMTLQALKDAARALWRWPWTQGVAKDASVFEVYQ
jgi:hypothetical protein